MVQRLFIPSGGESIKKRHANYSKVEKAAGSIAEDMIVTYIRKSNGPKGNLRQLVIQTAHS